MTPIFPTAYLPTVAYMASLLPYDSINVEQHETFPKQTLRNRAVIMTANGIMPLVVPAIRTKGNHTTTAEIEISYAENWNIQHWRSIETAYNSSPFFLYYKDGIEKIIMTPHERLIDLNLELTRYMLKKLKISCEINLTTDYIRTEDAEVDLRSSFSIKQPTSTFSYPVYSQVFEDKHSFQPDLSIIDLLFNLGPDAKDYLTKVNPT